MANLENLSDKQLIELINSEGRLDKELQEKIVAEIDRRELQTEKAQEKPEEGLTIEQRLFYLLPLGFITYAFAAKFRGRGEKLKFKQAWDMIILSHLLFYGVGILYFVLAD